MNISDDMKAVLEQFGKFNAPKIENLTPNAARNNPTFKNAVEEMAANSATVRTMNVGDAGFTRTCWKNRTYLDSDR